MVWRKKLRVHNKGMTPEIKHSKTAFLSWQFFKVAISWASTMKRECRLGSKKHLALSTLLISWHKRLKSSRVKKIRICSAERKGSKQRGGFSLAISAQRLSLCNYFPFGCFVGDRREAQIVATCPNAISMNEWESEWISLLTSTPHRQLKRDSFTQQQQL